MAAQMARPGKRGEETPNESLGILLLPSTLEGFELEAHARDLLSIDLLLTGRNRSAAEGRRSSGE